MKKNHNGHITDKTVRSIARKIAKRFHVEKVILFGSYAYGKPSVTSDVDLLVVMKTNKRPSDIRFSIYSELANFPVPIDVVIRTREQLESAKKRRDWFLLDILEKGRVVYG